MSDEGGSLSVVQDVRHFVPPVRRVDGHCDPANERQAEPGVEDFRHVGQEQTDPVAPANAQSTEHAGGLPAPLHQLPVGDSLSSNLDESLVGVGGRDDFKKFAQGFFPGMPIG